MAHAAQLSLKELQDSPPELVVISPNDPTAMIQYVQECQEMQIPYIYDPSQQIVRLTGEVLCRGIQGARALFVNDYEYALVMKMTGLSADEMLRDNPQAFIVVTRGEKGATVYTNSQVYDLPVVKPEEIIDPTGVGDAFRGGFLTGYSRDLDLPTCAQMGALAATYCLEQRGPQGHTYTPTEFVNRFRTIFDDDGKLDVIIRDR
jgi:adenosine kinase